MNNTIDLSGLFGLFVTMIIVLGFWRIFFAPAPKPKPVGVRPRPPKESPAVVISWHDEVDYIEAEVVEEETAPTVYREKASMWQAKDIDYISPEAQAMLGAGWMYDASQRREHVPSATVTAIGLPSIPPGDPRNPKG